MSVSSLAFLLLAGLTLADTTDKRGLVFTPNKDHPDDNKLWVQDNSDLTWYYNYGSTPSPVYASIAQDKFEFVPMMWGVGPNLNDTKFLDDVSDLIKDGRKITHAMAFNEPDTTSSVGGSQINPKDAATAWVANFEPLAKQGVKLGLPACTGAPTGLVWLQEFLGNCSQLVSTQGDKKNCTWDFLPVHWYDNFAGLASHIGERRSLWPNKTIWVTEYAYAHQDLATTQEYFNQTTDFFNKLDYIGKYSYFGAFRSDTSNVGPNAPFLNNDGKLTDIGSWYLGFKATNVNPESSAPGTKASHLLAAVAGLASFAVTYLL